MKEIKVLGPGCPNCEKLARETQKAAYELSLECHIEKVTDIQKITSYGVMITPALVVDGQVKFSGKVPSVEQLKAILSQ